MDAGEAMRRDALVDRGLLIATGVDGLYGRDARFEAVLDALEALIGRLGAPDAAERVRFPPIMPRAQLEASGYLDGFPHFAGTVHCFCGDEAAHATMRRRIGLGQDWGHLQSASDLVLTPAACYPVYPMLAARGPLADEGAVVDVLSYCFRREPSGEPTRLQSFRMREFVRIGTPPQVAAFRETWLSRARAMADTLGLPHEIEVAHDPFFGRFGRVMAEGQVAQQLKFELLVAVNPPDADGRAAPTACISFNTHLDHFSRVWPLRRADGQAVHTGCVAFGMERLTLALFRHHGLDSDRWPGAVRRALWPPVPRP